LNIQMNLAAKSYWTTLTDAALPDTHYRLAHEPWSVWLGHWKLCQDLQQQLIDHIHGDSAVKWWTGKEQFGRVSGKAVNWKALALAMLCVSTPWRHWVSKHKSGFCRVRKVMARWNKWPYSKMMARCNKWPYSKCPWCGKEETASHVWRCQHPKANATLQESMYRLCSWMNTQKTQPGI